MSETNKNQQQGKCIKMRFFLFPWEDTNEQEQNLKDKKKQEHKTNELFNSVIIFFLCLLMS